jgi:hypothetical protein
MAATAWFAAISVRIISTSIDEGAEGHERFRHPERFQGGADISSS